MNGLYIEKAKRDFVGPGIFFEGASTLNALKQKKYDHEILQNIVSDYNNWNDANGAIWKATKEIEILQKQAGEQADSEMKTWARQLRTIATGVWGALLVVAAITTVILYRRETGQKLYQKNN